MLLFNRSHAQGTGGDQMMSLYQSLTQQGYRVWVSGVERMRVSGWVRMLVRMLTNCPGTTSLPPRRAV